MNTAKRLEYRLNYGDLSSDQIMGYAETMAEEARKEVLIDVLKELDGNLEVYREDVASPNDQHEILHKAGEEKIDADSCCNETLRNIINEVEKWS